MFPEENDSRKGKANRGHLDEYLGTGRGDIFDPGNKSQVIESQKYSGWEQQGWRIPEDPEIGPPENEGPKGQQGKCHEKPEPGYSNRRQIIGDDLQNNGHESPQRGCEDSIHDPFSVVRTHPKCAKEIKYLTGC
jgi:hypothetical protein